MYEGSEKVKRKKGSFAPKAQGLWNVCVREVGLLECETEIPKVPETVMESDRICSTVRVRVKLTPYVNRYYPIGGGKFDEKSRVLSDKTFIIDGACDIGIHNTSDGFHLHAVATGESIALGRALKKALALNCHTSEELNSKMQPFNAVGSSGKTLSEITGAQKKVLQKTCEQLNIDIEQYLQSRADVNMFEFEGSKILKSKAEEMLNELANWKTNPKKIDKEFITK